MEHTDLPAAAATPEASRARRRNFFVRYWRGEVPLGRSYWLVYVLLSIVITRTIAALQQRVLLGTSYDPKLIFAVVGGGLAASLPTAVWQLVGLWRSAAARRVARRARGKWAVWARLAQLNVILGTLAIGGALFASTVPSLTEVYRMAFLGDPGIPDYGFRTMREGTEAEIVGGFKYGLTRDFTALMKANPKLRTVHLDSVGGRIGEARHLYRAIKARGLDTYVAAGCYSACTMAFAAGDRRWLGPRGVLGFHAPAFPGVSGHLSGMASYEAKVFDAAGFAPAFVAKAVAVIPPAIWKPSRQVLAEAHVVTGFVGLDRFADSGAGLDLTEAKWDAKVKKALPSLAVLAESRPDAFRPIAAAALASYREGASAQVVGQILGGGFKKAFTAMLPAADDDTLIAYAQLVVDEYAELNAKSPEDCYLYGKGETGVRDIAAELSPALKARDSALQARVVATKSPRVKLDPVEDQVVRRRFLAQLATKAPSADLKALTRPQTKPAGKAAYCRGIIALFRTAADMDPKSAGAALSQVLGGGK